MPIRTALPILALVAGIRLAAGSGRGSPFHSLEALTMLMILRCRLAAAIAVISTIFLTGCASQSPFTPATVPATAIAALSDRAAVPGERIGPVRLAGKIDEVVKLFGPGTVRGPSHGGLFVFQTWDSIGLWVNFDQRTGNVAVISIESKGSTPWAEHATPDGIRLGTRQQDLVSVMGPPERTVTDGGLTSFYYERRGIRFTVSDVGPLAGTVSSMRVVWPSVPRGDTLVVPGKRISSIEVGAPLDEVLAILGGGYHMGEISGGHKLYYWPHLGLSFDERASRVFSVRATRHIPADAPAIRYATMENLGRDSTASQIREIFGEPSKADLSIHPRYWIYRSRGLGFILDDEQNVRSVDIFPPENRPGSDVSVLAATGRIIEIHQLSATPALQAIARGNVIKDPQSNRLVFELIPPLITRQAQPPHTLYVVEIANGTLRFARSLESFPQGACVDIRTKLPNPDRQSWLLGESTLHTAAVCK